MPKVGVICSPKSDSVYSNGHVKQVKKPIYCVPFVKEINALLWNGLNVVSTFSGCGGSSLGYRMAGFRVLWANEFVHEAAEAYELNKSPNTILDRRDIRRVTADDIMDSTGLCPGDLDLFDSSPPCQRYSRSGLRTAGWGQERNYGDGQSQNDEEMFSEFLRLLRGLMPKTFVAENVTGIAHGKIKRLFADIVTEMKDIGYDVSCRVLDSAWLGVPQFRKRTIFVGVRCDLVDGSGSRLQPVFPSPLPFTYSIREAFPVLPTARIIGRIGSRFQELEVNLNAPIPTIGADQTTQVLKMSGQGVSTTVRNRTKHDRISGEPSRNLFISEVRRLCGFPDDFQTSGDFIQQWKQLGNSVPPPMSFWVGKAIRDGVLFKEGREQPCWLHDLPWFKDLEKFAECKRGESK